MHRNARAFTWITLLSILLWGGGALFAAPTTSQFPNGNGLHDLTDLYVGTSGDLNNGDRDATVVVFFSIPDSTPSSTIYFGVHDPANTGPSVDDPYDQTGSGGTSYWYLIGGPGALSDPSSQLIQYNPYPSTQPLAGTVLQTFTSPPDASTGWKYFGGVRPNQGEHIGNKYYFKVVMQADPNVGKNAFQLDVQTSAVATPSTTTDVKDSTGTVTAGSFAFDWSPIVSTTSATTTAGPSINAYPFIPSGMTGNVSSHTWDFDNTVPVATNNLYGSSGTSPFLGSISIGGASLQGDKNFNLLIYPYTNTFWHLALAGQNSSGALTGDLAEFWFTNGTAPIRTYSSPLAVTAPDHAALTYGSGTIPTGGSGRVLVQIVDSNGSPVLISKNVRVVVSGTGSPQITGANSTSTALPAQSVLVTTDGSGLGYVDVTDSVSDSVSVTAYTDGTNGSSFLGAGTVTSLSPNLAFSSSPPTISLSPSPAPFTAATTSTLLTADITVTAGANSQITAANGIEITIPTSLNLSFDTTSTLVFSGSGSGNVNSGASSFLSAKTIFVALSSDLTIGQSVTISGTVSGVKVAVPLATSSSGKLLLSTDGGATFPVSTSQTITVNITPVTYTWQGGTGNWSNVAHWVGGVVPPDNAAVVIPSGQGNITIDVVPATLASLSVASTLDPNGYNLTVSGATTLDGTILANVGQLTFGGNVTTTTGTGTLNGSSTYTYFGGNLGGGAGTTSFSANGGTAVFNGTGNQSIAQATTFQYLNIQNSSGAIVTTSAGTGITVNLNLSIASGSTFDTGGRNLTVTGALTNSGTLRLTGGETTFSVGSFGTQAGTVAYYGTGGYTGLKAGNNYYNLSFLGTGTYTLNAAITVANNLALAAGILDVSAGNRLVTVGGDWNHSGGTFNPRAGTVIFDTVGTVSQILGSTIFNMFSSITPGKVLQFQAGSTQTIGGTLTLTGATGSLIKLQSTSAGTQWTFAISANQNVSYVSVQDGNVTSGSAVSISATSSANVSNNDTVVSNGYWNFVSAPASWTWTGGASSTSWTAPTNWSAGTGYPGYGDSVTIPTAGTGFYPQLIATRTVSSLTITGSGSLNTNGQNLVISSTTTTPGGLTLASGGTLTATGSETIKVDGNIDLSGGSYNTATSTLIASGGPVGTSFTLKTAASLYNLTVNMGSTQTLTMSSAVSTSALGAFTLTSGIVNLNGFGLSVPGSASLAATIENLAGGGAGMTVTGAAMLAGTTLISSNGAQVTFTGAVTSPITPYALTVNKGAGTLTFASQVGSGAGNALASLTTDAAGTVAINGGSVTTSGTQTYNGPVSLGAATLLSSTGGNISPLSTVNGGFPLSVTTSGAGAVNLGGTVGGTGPLTTLTVNSSGTASIAAVTTSAAQSYTATTSTTLNGTLAVNTAGAGVTFSGPVLLAGGGGTISLTGSNAANSVSFGATATLNGTQPLSITAGTTGGGSISFAAAVGAVTPIGATTLTANTMTFSAGAGTFHGNSTIRLQPTTAATTVGVAGAAGTLQITDTDIKSLAAGFTQIRIGRTDGTVAVSVNAETFTSPVLFQSNGVGGTIALYGSITTSTSSQGAIGFTPNVTLGGGPIVITGAGAAADTITFGGTIDGTQALTIAAGLSTVTFNAAVGGTTPLASFALTNGTLVSNARNITVNGALNTSGGNWNMGSSGTVKAGGNVTLGTVTNGSGSILVLDGAGAQLLTLTTQVIGTVHTEISGTAATLVGSPTVDGIAVDAGTSLALGGASGALVTVAGGSTDPALSGPGVDVLTAPAGVPPAGQLNLNGTNGAVTLTMAAGTTITNSGALQVTNSANTVTLTSSVAGTTLSAASNQLSLGGNRLSLGYFTTAVTHTLGANDRLVLVGPVTFSSLLTLNGASSQVTTASNTLTVSAGVTATNGTVNVTGSGSVNAGTSAVTIGALGFLTLNSTASPTVQCGDFTSSGTITNTLSNTISVGGNVAVSTAAMVTPTNSTITMNGSGKTIDASVQIGNLTIPTGVSVSVLTHPLSLAGVLSITSTGDLNLGGNALTVTGAVSGTGTLTATASEAISAAGGWSISNFVPVTSAVTFAGGTVTPGAYNFYDVIFSQAVTLGGNLGVLRDLTINVTTGSVTAGTNTITVGRNWTNNRGAAGYSGSGVGAVVFNDNTQTSIVAGATSFNNLSCTTTLKTIEFAPLAANATTVGGNFTVTGTSGGSGLITLASQTPGSQWNISVAGTAAVDYAVVSDSNNTGTTITATHSRNAGNNTNWTFTPSNITWTGATSTSWNTGSNWSDGYVPNTTDNAIINNGSSFDLDVGGLSSATTLITGLTVNGTVNATSAGSVDVQGSMSVTGIALFGTPGNTTWVMTGSAPTITSSLGTSIGNLTVQPGAANSVILSSSLAVSGLFLSNGTLAAAGNGLSVSGNITRTTGLITSGGTVTLNGTAAGQTADFTGSTLANLTVDNTFGTPTVTLSNTAAFTSNGNLTITSGNVVMPNLSQTIGGNISGGGSLDASAIAAANTLTVGGYVGTPGTVLASLSAPAGTISVGGNWDVTALTAGTGIVSLDGGSGAGPFTITSNAQSFNNLIVNAAGKTYQTSGALSAGGYLNVPAGTLRKLAADNITVTGAFNGTGGILDFNGGGTMTVGGNVTFGAAANGSASILVMNGGAARTLVPNTQVLGTLHTKVASTAVTLAGTVTVDGIAVDASTTLTLGATGAAAVTVAGGSTDTTLSAIPADVLVSVANGLNLDGTNGTVTVTMGSGLHPNTKIDNAVAGGIRVVSSTNTVTINTAGGTTTLSGNDLNYNGQTLHLGNLTSALATNLSTASDTVIQDANVNFSGGVSLSPLGTNTSQWQVGTHTLTSGPITAGIGGTLTIGAGATVNAGTSTVTVSGGDITFAATPANLACGDLTVSAGTITNTAVNTITATGNVTLSIANANFSSPANSTIVMGASTGKAINATTTIGNLTVNPGAGNTDTISTNTLTLAGALIVQSGTFGLNSQDMTVATDVSGAGRLTAAASEAVSVGGNWSLSLLTAGSSTVTFTGLSGAGPFTITSNAQSFNNLVVNASGKIYGTSGALSAAGYLDVPAGTLLRSGTDSITVTGAFNGTGGTLDFNGIGGGTMTVGGNVTIQTAANGPGSILVLDGGAAQTLVPNSQVLGTLHTKVASTAVTLAGTVTVDGIAVDAGTSLTLGTTGAAAVTVAGGTTDPTLTGPGVDVLVNATNGLSLDGTAGTVAVTMGSGTQPNTKIDNAVAGGIRVVSSANTVTIDTAGGTTTLSGNDLNYNGQTLHLGHLTSALATSLSTANDTVIQDANVTFSGGVSLSPLGTNTSDWQIGTSTLTAGPITVGTGGTLDASGGGNLSVSGNVVFSGGTFTKGTGLFSFVATGAQSLTSGGQDLGNIATSDATILTVADAGNFDSVTIGATSGAAGSINLSAAITVGGNWTNNIGFTGLVSNGHGVTFDKASGTVTVLGNTRFFSFNCTVSGLFINFGPTTVGGSNDTTEILTGGVFHVVGVDNPVDGTYDANWITLNVTNGPADGYWHLTMDSGAVFNMSFVQVNWSYADIAVTTPANVQTVNCFQWFSSDPVMASYAEDSDGDGKIDRIRVVCVAAVNDNFSDFTVSVSGYTVRSSNPFTTGTAFDNTFYINLNENPDLDTGATVTWQITHNTLLRDQVNNAQLVVIPGGTAVAADGASPVIAYTLAVAGKAQIFMRFSEPVYANAGTNTALTSGDFAISGGTNQTVTSVVPVASSGNGYSEILLNLSAPVAASDIATPETITLSVGQDNPTVAPSPIVNPPGSPGVPAAHSLLSNFHRITDVGLGPPGAGVIEPVFAWDQTMRDPQLGGIGLITKFDGSEFLAPQNITIQANVNGALSGHTLSLWIDSKPSASVVGNGLWLPPFNESNYSGLVPYPDTGADNSASGPTSPGGQLENWVIPSTNSNIYNHANLQFFFADNTVSPPLYYGRMTNANSPTWYLNVRPWTIDVMHVISQRANVTILNNVINPDKGQKASLYYTLPNPSLVTIVVFDLSGDIVSILYRGQLTAGDHSTTWNGTNQQGRAVARGIYFMRVVASGIDEYRKVLVVR